MGDHAIDIRGYTVHEAIARGTSAVVFRGVQQSLGRPVAIKVFRSSFANDHDAEAFRTEIAALGRLSNHPNIVSVIEADVTVDGIGFIVSALMEGSLVGMCDADPAALARHLRIGTKIAGALSVAHGAGFVHCDVKPGNVLLSEYGEPALSDFGSATYPGSSGGPGGHRITLDYAAPELLAGAGAVPESDVFSWAATIHYLLTGSPPHRRDRTESVESFTERIRNDPYQPPSVAPAIDDALGDLLGSSLEVRPGDRPTAAEFADALNDIAEMAGFPPTQIVGTADIPDHGAGTGINTEVGPPTWPPSGGSGLTGPAPTEGSRRQTSLLSVAGLVLLIAGIVAVVAWRTLGDPPGKISVHGAGATRKEATRTGATTSTTRESFVTPVVHLPPDPAEAERLDAEVQRVADHSAQLNAQAATILSDQSVPLWVTFSYSDAFPPSAYFPALDPLPARARWVFNTPDEVSTGQCKEFIPPPITMAGFASRGSLRTKSLTSVLAYSFPDLEQAKTFFVGKSMLLGSTRLDCTPGTKGNWPTIIRRDFDLNASTLEAAGAGVDEWNGFISTDKPRFVRPTESEGYNLVARKGREIYEVRVGIPEPGATGTPEQIADYITTLLATMQTGR